MMAYKMEDNLSIKADAQNISALYNHNRVGDNIAQKSSNCMTGWSFWEREYYPKVIRDSYPIYIQERAQDKGKQAFEIIKALQDKKLMKLETVADFIEAMDTLIKTL